MKRLSLFKSLLLLALPFALSLACSLSAGPPSIGEVVTAKSLDADYKAVEPTSTYLSTDTFTISVEVKDLVVGSVVEVKYNHEGEPYDSMSTTADKAGSGHYGFTLRPGEGGHLPGNYTADVYLDGVLAKTVSYTVEPSGPPEVLETVMAKSLDDSYKPVDPTTTFAPTDTIYVSVKVSNLLVGSEVVVKFIYKDQSMDQTITSESAGSGYFGFSLAPSDTGHPAGDYTLETYLDGNLVNSQAFTVAP